MSRSKFDNLMVKSRINELTTFTVIESCMETELLITLEMVLIIMFTLHFPKNIQNIFFEILKPNPKLLLTITIYNLHNKTHFLKVFMKTCSSSTKKHSNRYSR